jgi:hypothetical protein
MAVAQSDQARQLADVHLRTEIRIDVGERPLDLPYRQGSRSRLIRSVKPCRRHNRIEQGRGIAKAAPSHLAVPLEECHCLSDKISSRHSHSDHPHVVTFELR